jgi:U3 small nucleolar RNA-associated protein 20
MDLLVEYISKKDELSMEPLLSLVAQFARDLGPRFEKHFATAVQLVSSVAATHESIEVIEWSFTCLAWIFKFLSRLLAPDLRQLLGIMTPYLGKERQKYFVTRFAAESMSFLLRKAALVYYKDKAPLQHAVNYLLTDLETVSDARQVGMYQTGLMALFSEAVKGLKGGLHSNGPDILRCLFLAAASRDKDHSDRANDILSGVLINLVHHCRAEEFSPVLEVVCDEIESPQTLAGDVASSIQCRSILVCLAARKGTRVRDWQRVHKVLLRLLERTAGTGQFRLESIQHILGAVAVAVQTSPMDELLPYMRQIMEALVSESLSPHFLPFCSFFSVLGPDRFQSVVITYFQR